MKLACASSAFALAISGGALTQLEWLDLCARRLQVDGVVCDVAHFPRRDGDYLAQIKKMAADLGLSIGAVWDEGFFGADEAAMQESLALCDAIGSPLLCAPLGCETTRSWTAQLQSLSNATSLAKTINVTLAVRNAPNTFAATAHDLRRVSKETDSAWLRYALEIDALDAASDPQLLTGKTVMLWHEHSEGQTEDAEGAPNVRTLRAAENFCGFLTLDTKDGSATQETMLDGVRAWRTMLAQEVLGRSVGA